MGPGRWVQPFNFHPAAPVDQAVTLSAVEIGAPAAGRRAASRSGSLTGGTTTSSTETARRRRSATSLPTDNRVLGTDVVSAPYAPPFSRPGILLLNNDLDGDGAVLGTAGLRGDRPDPVTRWNSGSNRGIDGPKRTCASGTARITPDPSIRPWPAGPDRQWQSPDIEIQNARNLADPVWFNVPWVGNAKRCRADKNNGGNRRAPRSASTSS